MPEGSGEEGSGEERHPARVALPMQQLTHCPDGRRNGRQPRHGCAQPQRQWRHTEQFHPQSGPVEEQHLFAGVRGDEDGGLDATGDFAGQDTVSGLVVMEAEWQFGQPVQPQSRRDEQH